METTIIYYTSNIENEFFEKKIRDNILRQTDLPIISVSHKPIEFGKNICIGEKPVCYLSLWKQQLIGLKEAKTKYCITAEADCLYPPEYFTFIPERDDLVYRYKNVWCFWDNKSRFWQKPCMEGAQMCNRKYWIERLEQVLESHKEWQELSREGNRKIALNIFKGDDRTSWNGNPVLTFKTDKAISRKTALSRTPAVRELPYWGEANLIHNKYLNG